MVKEGFDNFQIMCNDCGGNSSVDFYPSIEFDINVLIVCEKCGKSEEYYEEVEE